MECVLWGNWDGAPPVSGGEICTGVPNRAEMVGQAVFAGKNKNGTGVCGGMIENNGLRG